MGSIFTVPIAGPATEWKAKETARSHPRSTPQCQTSQRSSSEVAGSFQLPACVKSSLAMKAILGHGSREMPVWGPIFHQIQEDRDYGEVRLQNITDYLKSIQK